MTTNNTEKKFTNACELKKKKYRKYGSWVSKAVEIFDIWLYNFRGLKCIITTNKTDKTFHQQCEGEDDEIFLYIRLK